MSQDVATTSSSVPFADTYCRCMYNPELGIFSSVFCANRFFRVKVRLPLVTLFKRVTKVNAIFYKEQFTLLFWASKGGKRKSGFPTLVKSRPLLLTVCCSNLIQSNKRNRGWSCSNKYSVSLFQHILIQFLDSSYVHRSISRSRNWSRLKTGRLRNTGHNLILYSLWLLLQPYPLFLMLLQPHPLFCMLPRPYPLILMLLQPYPLFLRLLQPHPPLYVANLPQLVMRIRICIIKVGSGSVWRDTNPDPDPGHIR